MVFVEQPDTLFGDCFDPDEWPAVELYEFRTAHYDDPSDKFVRLTTRNVRLQAPTRPFAQPDRAPRSQFDYRDADERDRVRSSWMPHAHTCRALAAATPISPDRPPAVSLAAAIESFAVEYHLLYGNVPSGYLGLECRPPDAASQAYQTVRGPGDGRHVSSVQPLTLSDGLIRDQGYAALFSDLQLNQSAHSRDFARTTNTALDARNRQLTPAEPASPTAPPPLRRPLRAQPQQPTYVGPPARLQRLPTTGDPATQWSFQPAPGRLTHAKSSEARGGQPPYSASTDQQARVSFDVAQTRDGRPYENELLPLDDLRVAVV